MTQSLKKNIFIISEIVSAITKFPMERIAASTSLRNDLKIDSLQAIQIVNRIEDRFSIRLEHIEIFNVDTINEICDLIEEYQNNSIS